MGTRPHGALTRSGVSEAVAKRVFAAVAPAAAALERERGVIIALDVDCDGGRHLPEGGAMKRGNVIAIGLVFILLLAAIALGRIIGHLL